MGFQESQECLEVFKDQTSEIASCKCSIWSISWFQRVDESIERVDPDLSKGSLMCLRKDFSDKMLVDSGQEIVSSWPLAVVYFSK